MSFTLPKGGRRCCEDCQFFAGVDPQDWPNSDAYLRLAPDVAYLAYEIFKAKGGIVTACSLQREWTLYGQMCPIIPIVIAHMAEEEGWGKQGVA